MASPIFSITHEEFFPIRNTKLSDTKGAPIDGFLLNALKSLFRLPTVLFRSLEMHSKRCYKFASVHARVTRGFLKLRELQCYFPENLRCNCTFYESENFCYPCLHRNFESENFRFSFSTKLSLTQGVKYEIKIKLQKILGNLV